GDLFHNRVEVVPIVAVDQHIHPRRVPSARRSPHHRVGLREPQRHQLPADHHRHIIGRFRGFPRTRNQAVNIHFRHRFRHRKRSRRGGRWQPPRRGLSQATSVPPSTYEPATTYSVCWIV